MFVVIEPGFYWYKTNDGWEPISVDKNGRVECLGWEGGLSVDHKSLGPKIELPNECK